LVDISPKNVKSGISLADPAAHQIKARGTKIMAEISLDEFLEYVEEWMTTNEAAIAKMWPQDGGWEGWAQAEIFRFIGEKNHAFDIGREKHCFTNNRKGCDFLLNDSSALKNKVIVELKCQSFSNYKRFAKGLSDDTTKLIKDLKPAYVGANLLIIGMYFTAKTEVPKHFAKKVIGKGEIGICWATDSNG
jgi:hypothetical protein